MFILGSLAPQVPRTDHEGKRKSLLESCAAKAGQQSKDSNLQHVAGFRFKRHAHASSSLLSCVHRPDLANLTAADLLADLFSAAGKGL